MYSESTVTQIMLPPSEVCSVGKTSQKALKSWGQDTLILRDDVYFWGGISSSGSGDRGLITSESVTVMDTDSLLAKSSSAEAK